MSKEAVMPFDNETLRCSPNADVFNCSVEEYLTVVMGPQRLPLERIVPMSILLVLIFLTGLAGNVATCVVIVRHPSMHTATNYYLFSLAVSDLLLLLTGLPNDLAVYWHQYPYSFGIGFCKLRAVVSEAASYVSVLTIVAFSLERYLAICHPLHLYAMAGLHRAVRIIAALWIFSLLSAAPFGVYTDISYHAYPPSSESPCLESAFCALVAAPYFLLELSSLLFFIAPALVMVYLYTRMGLRIRSRHGHQGQPVAFNGINGSVHGEARQAKSRKVIIRMLAAVVVAFFLCWAPFHFQRLFYIYGSDIQYFDQINEHIFNVTGALYYVSATVNPILYNVMSNRYRVAFRETLCWWGARRRRGSRFRDHSSFRETTMNQCSEGTHLVRVRSLAERRKLESSRASETRSSNFDCKPYDTGIVLNNNVFDKKRNSKNLSVNFNNLEKVEKNTSNLNISNSSGETDASKISIEIFLEGRELDREVRLGELSRRDVITLVGEITNEKTRSRQELYIVVGGRDRCGGEARQQSDPNLNTETCM